MSFLFGYLVQRLERLSHKQQVVVRFRQYPFKTVKGDGEMDGIILIKPGSTLILQSMRAISKEEMEKERSWLKEKMDLDVKIIRNTYEIKAVQEDG